MRPYLAMFRARFAALLQYRAAAAAGVATQLFWGFIRIMILGAFYASTTEAQPLTLAQVTTYVWLGQATIGLIFWRPAPDFVEMVRSGNVAYELLRPVDLYSSWYAREIAQRVAPTLLRAIPLTILALAFLGMGPPASVAAGLAFALSMVAAVLLSAAVATLTSALLLWTVSGRGIIALLNACVWIFSGMILPLPLFPDWAQPILDVLPFRGIQDAPFRLYVGHIEPARLAGLLAHQLAWTLGFVLLGRALLASTRKRLVVQGG